MWYVGEALKMCPDIDPETQNDPEAALILALLLNEIDEEESTS